MTPGPWNAWKVHEMEVYTVVAQRSDPLLSITIGYGYKEDDARLIAAAPELLEACKAARRLFTRVCGGASEPLSESSFGKMLDQVIAKAEHSKEDAA